MLMDRRAALAGLGVAAIGFAARAGTVTDTDVIIIGAGVAGISAARALKALGLSAVILEARDRIGGRALTETGTLGRAFDRGPYWLHNKATNPLVPLARQAGVGLLESSYSDGAVFDQGSLSRDVTWKAVLGAASTWELRQRLLLTGLKDRPLGATIPNPTPAQRHLKNIWAVEMGDDPDRVSRDGYYVLEAGEDLIPDIGMGSLVQGLARDLPVRLNSPVTRLTWSEAHGVTAEGAFGQIRARKAIVTVPTGVLASGALRFDPALPVATQTAINNLPMGALEKVAMVLDRPIPDLPEYAISNGHVQQGQYHALVASPDKQMITALLPGPMSRRLGAEGPAAMEAFALGVLRNAIGSSAQVRSTATTHWLGDPFALGSYPHQSVGHLSARRVYSQPIEDRLFFAGDASDDPLAVTVGGAWRQGGKAAQSAARLLNARIR